MGNLIIKITNLTALLGAIAWFFISPDWEPFVTSLCLFATLVGLEIKDFRNQRPNPDIQLFQKFIEVLPSIGGSIEFIDQFNMAGFAFDYSKFNDLIKFCHEWDNAEREFSDQKLEGLRKKLMDISKEYLSFIAQNTWMTGTSLHTVPPEWEIEQPERFHKTVSKLHNMAASIVQLHQELVRYGRKKLKL